ncbi:MAG: RNA polymerase sigma-54 factor, partial [Patescibacteria group bacterium]
MLKQNLSHRLLQKLSPQQIQLMKLLQIPTATLEQRVKEELEANPALEEGEENEDTTDLLANNDEKYADDKKDAEEDFKEEPETFREDEFELDDYINEYIEDDPSSYKLKVNNYSADEEEKTIPIAVEDTFHEYLETQLGMLKLVDEREELVARQIIGSIDDDGYLRREPVSIIDDLLFSQNITATEEEIFSLLKQIQRFDPPGIGAMDLQECLMIQLNHRAEHQKDTLEKEDQETFDIAIRIIDEYFNEFSKKHYQKLQRYLNITEKQLKNAIDEVLKLNPKPASGY